MKLIEDTNICSSLYLLLIYIVNYFYKGLSYNIYSEEVNIIKSIEFKDINGRKQAISIRGDEKGLPLLLYLHGGPGDTALPLVNKYNKDLEKYFTVVVWEQRGAGKSYYNFDNEHITIDTFVNDAVVIIKDLLKKYKQEKLYLVGHSWGSVLGIKVIQSCPELIYTYVGCGQVINMEKSCKIAYEYAIKKSLEAKNKKELEKLKGIDYTYKAQSWIDDLLYVTGKVVKYKGSFYGKKNYNIMIKDFILSREYSIRDLIKRQKGSYQAIKYIWPELMGINFEGIHKFDVPVVFIEGRYDYHVSSNLVKEYFDTIESEKQFYWFENSCHFPQWCEPQKFTEVMKSLL